MAGETIQEQQGNIAWRDGQPVSRAFDDVYFSRASGIDETRYVFLQQNRLRERWQALLADRFTIGETGFGTGLNFLCAWQLWRECTPPGARLHFVSTELYPLCHDDLTRALALWPELADLARALLDQYRLLAPGWRRFTFDDGRVTLTLLLGDARDTLRELRAAVDAWFLDGFAPAKNPQMWQPELLAEIARLSAAGATFATFTSAGLVRRGLQAAGFEVEKVPGYGSKREMLRGSIVAGKVRQTASERQALVIGGGISGCATAYSLAQRGWQVTLLERHGELASEASGNPQGILYPRLSGHDIPLSRIALAGFLHTLALLQRLLPKGRGWDDCGLLQLAHDASEQKRCDEVAARGWPAELVQAVDADAASQLAGLPLSHGGLWLPTAGWLHPPALCQALAAQPGICVQTSQEALRLVRGEHGWQAWGERCLAEAPVVVVCGASDSRRFVQTAHLPLQPVRGQITLLPATAASTHLRTVLCGDGYAAPARDGQHCVGATFAPGNQRLELDAADHASNLAMLRTLAPALHAALGAEALDSAQLTGRAALRCAAPDRLPLAGPLLDATCMQQFTPGSRIGPASLPWLSGLLVNTGHGSKGMLTAPLCGELIAGWLAGEPAPVDAGLLRALDPNRFLLRAGGRKNLIGTAFG